MSKEIKILFFLFFLLSSEILFAQSITAIKKEKEKSEKEILYLNKLLSETHSDKSVSVEKLAILQQKIVQSERLLHSLKQEVSYFEDSISKNQKKISEFQANKASMLDLYSKLIYNTWKKRDKANKLMFIFSSSDFNQAYNRFKYFQQIQDYSKRQIRLIEQINDSLDVKNQELKKLVGLKNEKMKDIGLKKQEFQSEKANENFCIEELKKKEKELIKKIQIETKNREKLADELNKLISKQTKASGGSSTTYKLTPEEKLVSDDFVKNKGKLPWPVAEGFVSEKFGINIHPVYKKVETVNDGVSITTSKNADVRAVFNGVVTEIVFFPGGYNNVVIVRHGNYLTVYSNLLDVSVQKGQKVSTKSIIGKIAFDGEKGSILNFQVWKDTEKLDPELWLAK